MKVSIYGPNLNDQRKGEFHVHASDCADCRKYGPGRPFGGEDGMADPMEVLDQTQVAAFVYEDIIDESESTAQDYLENIYFAPCLRALPKAA